MKPLQEMTFAQRFGLTIAICLVILFALALFGYLTGRWDEAQAQQRTSELYEGITPNTHLLHLDRVALDAAYSTQLQKLFGVWLSSQAGDATAFQNGLRIARRAYELAVAQIAAREHAIQELQKQKGSYRLQSEESEPVELAPLLERKK